MNRFRFPLERARAWRLRQMELEEQALEALQLERAALDTALRQFLHEATCAIDRLVRQPHLDRLLLEELTIWKEYSVIEARRRQLRLATQDERIAAQRQRVIEARRKFELLDHLRQRRFAEWQEEEKKKEDQERDELAVLRWRIRAAAGSPESA